MCQRALYAGVRGIHWDRQPSGRERGRGRGWVRGVKSVRSPPSGRASEHIIAAQGARSVCTCLAPGFFWARCPLGACPLSPLGPRFVCFGVFFCWAGVSLSCASARLLLLPFPGEVLWLVAVPGCLVVPWFGVLPPPLVGRRSSAPRPSAPARYYPGALLLTASAY